jgi:mono/diheme cytochrome c family protein
MRLKTLLLAAGVACLLGAGITACGHSETPDAAARSPARANGAGHAGAIAGPPVAVGLAARGELLATRHCATCHAVGRTGASPRPEAPAFRDLGERYPPEALEEAFAEGILVGHSDMPEFRFEPADITALVAYLHKVQAKKSG